MKAKESQAAECRCGGKESACCRSRIAELGQDRKGQAAGEGEGGEQNEKERNAIEIYTDRKIYRQR